MQNDFVERAWQIFVDENETFADDVLAKRLFFSGAAALYATFYHHIGQDEIENKKFAYSIQMELQRFAINNNIDIKNH